MKLSALSEMDWSGRGESMSAQKAARRVWDTLRFKVRMHNRLDRWGPVVGTNTTLWEGLVIPLKDANKLLSTAGVPQFVIETDVEPEGFHDVDEFGDVDDGYLVVTPEGVYYTEGWPSAYEYGEPHGRKPLIKPAGWPDDVMAILQLYAQRHIDRLMGYK